MAKVKKADIVLETDILDGRMGTLYDKVNALAHALMDDMSWVEITPKDLKEVRRLFDAVATAIGKLEAKAGMVFPQ